MLCAGEGSAQGTLPAGAKNGLFEPFMHKCTFLPRQARDKHRENSSKRPFQSADYLRPSLRGRRQQQARGQALARPLARAKKESETDTARQVRCTGIAILYSATCSNIMVLLGLSKTRAIVLYTISLRWASAGAQARGRAEATHGTTTEARG